MDESNSKAKRGGRREGAGRPNSDSKLITFRAPGYMAKCIEGQENKTEFIKKCIDSALRTEPDFSRLGDVFPASRIEEIRLPFFDISLVAGFPIPLDNDEKSQDIDLTRMLCPNYESSYLIRVKGDSMIDAGVHSGDILIVDKSNRNPSPQEVAVCELNGEYTLKRFERDGNGGWLIPANPAFPKIQVTEGDDFSIWGVVTYIIHKPQTADKQ